MEFKITKEQIDRLSKMAECGSTNVIKADLKNWFSEAFKTELIVGKWYKFYWDCEPDKVRGIYYVESINDNEVWFEYGIDFTENNWQGKDWYSKDHIWIEATPKEVKEALIAEAKNRGYVHGAKFKSSISENGIVRTVRADDTSFFDFYSGFNKLTTSTDKKEWENKAPQSNPDIFKDGKWAEIIPEEKTVITLEKAKKILAKKFKTTVEQIEIK